MNKLIKAVNDVLERWDLTDSLDSFCVGDSSVIEALRQAVQEAETPKEYTDVEDFIAKTSKPFEPADLFVGGMDGYVNLAGWGISIKNDIPVTLTVRDEIYDVVPRGRGNE